MVIKKLPIALVIAFALAYGACALSPTQGGEIGGYFELVDTLRTAGAKVDSLGRIDQSAFNGMGRAVQVNGVPVKVFEYADIASRKADSDMISTEETSVGTNGMSWKDQSNFWAAGRVIVQYDGTDRVLLDLLKSAMGEPINSPADDPAVYAAVVRQLYTEDHTFNEPPYFPIVYLVRRTDDGIGDPDAPRADSRLLAVPVLAAIVADLDNLPAEFVWVDDEEQVPRGQNGAVAEGGAIITLGNIHYQEDDSALVSASLYVSPLVATGKTYVLERADSMWAVTGDSGAQWMAGAFALSSNT
jgi:hypothetical protein